MSGFKLSMHHSICLLDGGEVLGKLLSTTISEIFTFKIDLPSSADELQSSINSSQLSSWLINYSVVSSSLNSQPHQCLMWDFSSSSNFEVSSHSAYIHTFQWKFMLTAALKFENVMNFSLLRRRSLEDGLQPRESTRILFTTSKKKSESLQHKWNFFYPSFTLQSLIIGSRRWRRWFGVGCLHRKHVLLNVCPLPPYPQHNTIGQHI